jgi:hypothetical protein
MSDIEERAKRMGWVPADEFRGDPENWRDAEDFVKRGEEMLGIAKERNRALDTRIQQLEDTIKDFTEYHKTVEQRAQERAEREYKKEIQRIQEEMKAAVRDGDVNKFEVLEKEREQLKEPEEVGTPTNTPPAAFREWHKENRWYTAPGVPSAEGDKRISAYADKIALFFLEDPEFKYTAQDREFYDAVQREVEAKFPEKFEGVEAPPARGRVESGEKFTPRRKARGGKTTSDLPPEDRAQMKRFVSEGLLTEEQFLKDYEWED